jgi:SAM-dependent methyltransferase
LVLLIQGREPVALQDGFTCRDLGCGQGKSAELFAACHPEGEFHAIDFNPSQIAGARRLAELGNGTFWEASFANLAELSLPAFDFVIIHGVYSWVSARNRRRLVEFLRDRLKPGGVVYLSYNCLAGWSAHAPLRQLLYTYADKQSGTLEQRIESAVEFAGRLKSANAAIFEVSPATGNFFDYLCTLPRNYLAHEFFNRDWTLFCHAEVAQELAAAKLVFSGPAHFLENQDILRFSEAQQELLDGVADRSMRESVKDFVVSPLLRRDLYTNGRPEIDSRLQLRHLHGCRFALALPQVNLERKATFPVGEAVFDPQLYDPILLALELKPHTIGELLQRREITELGAARVKAALFMLLSAEYVVPAVKPSQQMVLRTGRLNRVLIERGADDTGKRCLASPVLRNAIKADWLERMLIRCEIEGHPATVASIREQVEADRHKRGRDGTNLLSEGESLEELESRIATFRNSQLPLLRQLGVL